MAGLLGGLDVEVIALGFLFALLAGSLILRPLLVAVLSRAPFVGGWLASNVDSGLAEFERVIAGPANAALGALPSSIDWIASTWGQLLSSITDAAQAVYGALWSLKNLDLPALEQRAHDWAGSAVGAAVASLRALIAGVEQSAAAGIAAARAEAVGLAQAAEAEAVTLTEAARAEAKGLFEVAEQDAAALVQAERAFAVGVSQTLEAEIQAVESKAHALTMAAEAALRGEIGNAAALAQSLAAQGANLTEQEIAAAKAQLQGEIAGVEQLIQDEISKALSAGPWAAAVAAYEGGEAALASDVLGYVALGYQAVKQELGEAQAIRDKYAPVVRAFLAQRRGS